jgi:hypothetical protein
MISPKKANKYFLWFVYSAAIFFVLYFFWLMAGSEFRGLPYVGDLSYLEEEFRMITPPEGAALSSDIKVLPKSTLHVVSAHFIAPSSVASIVKHYQDSLQKLGWRQVNMMMDNSNIKTVKFCKKDMDAILEFIVSGENDSRYYFGVRWEGGRLVKTGCNQ